MNSYTSVWNKWLASYLLWGVRETIVLWMFFYAWLCLSNPCLETELVFACVYCCVTLWRGSLQKKMTKWADITVNKQCSLRDAKWRVIVSWLWTFSQSQIECLGNFSFGTIVTENKIRSNYTCQKSFVMFNFCLSTCMRILSCFYKTNFLQRGRTVEVQQFPKHSLKRWHSKSTLELRDLFRCQVFGEKNNDF